MCVPLVQGFRVTWLLAFLLTQLIEVSTALLVIKKESKVRLALLVFTASSITHPILWFVIHKLCMEQELSHTMFLILGESYVVLIESMLYYIFKMEKPFRCALILNATSFIIGEVLQKML